MILPQPEKRKEIVGMIGDGGDAFSEGYSLLLEVALRLVKKSIRIHNRYLS
jgi:hypothetical protein